MWDVPTIFPLLQLALNMRTEKGNYKMECLKVSNLMSTIDLIKYKKKSELI